ncbi:MAG: GNAT family N-acetyltransferase [Planctomycetota bacterium]
MKCGIDDVRLRFVADGDRELIRSIEDEPAGNAMANVLPRLAEAFDTHWGRIMTSPAVVTRIVEVRDDNAWHRAGFVTSFLTSVEVRSESPERRCVGYRLGERWWGRGVMRIALGRFLEDAVLERPLWAVTAAENIPSQRVLSRCGFAVIDRRWAPATGRYPAGDEVVFRLDP